MLAKEPLRHDHWARVRRARLGAVEHTLWENDISRWLNEGGRDPTPVAIATPVEPRRKKRSGRTRA